ncbi:MAG TPA: sulfite exporter TauE/SafE family protein [Gemmatimonadaceae bacterium]|jgi:uncharacterized membrane protein YfcA|nr:sulfite exporter TauE/SafE family protein [Gemmatimonadaceae bacterium]
MMTSFTADSGRLSLVVLAAVIGGAVNSIAGGGTLLTFPALVGLGIPPIVANATSTVALWPGSVASVWGYRDLLSGMRGWVTRFAIPSLLGGLLGAALLLATPARRFDVIVPWLVFGATLLFLVQRPLSERLRQRAERHATLPDVADDHAFDRAVQPSTRLLLYQFGVAVYGGYFGAGIGILMLAALGFMGFRNIHRMNGLKNWGGLCANAVAAGTFAFSGLVSWPVAVAMAIGAAVGGYGGSRLAQRVPQARVRQAIVVIGFASTLWLLTRN